MKKMKVLSFMLLLLCTTAYVFGIETYWVKAKNYKLPEISAKKFYAMPKSEQDKELIAAAKVIVLEHGPDWYDESYPVKVVAGFGGDVDKTYVEFYFNKDLNEYFIKGEIAYGVCFDKETLKPEDVFFGNNLYIDLRVKTRSGEKEVMPFAPSPHQEKILPEGYF